MIYQFNEEPDAPSDETILKLAKVLLNPDLEFLREHTIEFLTSCICISSDDAGNLSGPNDLIDFLTVLDDKNEARKIVDDIEVSTGLDGRPKRLAGMLSALPASAQRDLAGAVLGDGDMESLVARQGIPAQFSDSDGQRIAQFGDAIKTVGWLKDLKQKPDGSLVQVLDVTSPKYAEAIRNGSIRFTSPELRDNYEDGRGRNFGRIFSHVALTPKPRNPDQGPIRALNGEQQIRELRGKCVNLQKELGYFA